MTFPFLSPSQLNSIGPKPFGAPAALVPGGQNLLWSSTQGQRLIGTGKFVWDDLQNLNAERNGSIDSGVSHRFRALTSGAVEQVQIWFQDGPGYSRGNGGTARFRIFPDDGTGKPNMGGTAMASATYALQNMSGGVFSPRTKDELFPLHTMTSVENVVAGQLYHCVIDNVAADPATNSFCSDCGITWTTVTGLNPHRWFNVTEFAALEGVKAVGSSTWTWSDATASNVAGSVGKAVPFLMVKIAGVWQGLMSVSSANTGSADSYLGITTTWLRSSSQPIRQRFTPTSTTAVTGVSFLASASVAGTLLVELKQGASVLATASVTQAVANNSSGIDPYSGDKVEKLVWYDVLFASTSMTGGVQYDLELTPQGSSVWRFQDMRNARDYYAGWQDHTCPNYGEHKVGASWYGTNGYNAADNNGVNGSWFLVLHKTA